MVFVRELIRLHLSRRRINRRIVLGNRGSSRWLISRCTAVIITTMNVSMPMDTFLWVPWGSLFAGYWFWPLDSVPIDSTRSPIHWQIWPRNLICSVWCRSGILGARAQLRTDVAHLQSNGMDESLAFADDTHGGAYLSRSIMARKVHISTRMLRSTSSPDQR